MKDFFIPAPSFAWSRTLIVPFDSSLQRREQPHRSVDLQGHVAWHRVAARAPGDHVDEHHVLLDVRHCLDDCLADFLQAYFGFGQTFVYPGLLLGGERLGVRGSVLACEHSFLFGGKGNEFQLRSFYFGVRILNSRHMDFVLLVKNEASKNKSAPRDLSAHIFFNTAVPSA